MSMGIHSVGSVAVQHSQELLLTSKRSRFVLTTDQILAVVLVIVLSPVLLLLAALIMVADGRPVLFGHYRVGKGGKLFRCWKFRSMYKNSAEMLAELLRTSAEARAEWDRDQKLTHDPRITPIGHFLRKTSLDELPQLFNVIQGDMNLVGPRPIIVAELGRYGLTRWKYLKVRPGMTGLWQVSGRNNTTYEERVELDRYYVDHRSWKLDLTILFKTVWVVVRRDGAR